MPAIYKPKNIVVAMSGGVDSAVCATLLKDAGHTVRCVYFVMSDAHFPGIDKAQDAARWLDLPIDIMDLRQDFEREIILPFCHDYCAGITPNPCVVCNPVIKFRALCDNADHHGFSHVATGHYAQVEQRDATPVLCRAQDKARDQSYMLYNLSPAQLSRLILPLGRMPKQEVRACARAAGLAAADAPDSQEICFIPNGNYPEYIHQKGMRGKQGNYLAPNGEIVGPHRGVEYYTIGQRHGLGVNLGERLFVRHILENGDIQLGFAGQEYAPGVRIGGVRQNALYPLQVGQQYQVKLRSAAVPALCEIVDTDDETVAVRFDKPQRAPSPGQSAVLYDGDCVAAGGVIRSSFIEE